MKRFAAISLAAALVTASPGLGAYQAFAGGIAVTASQALKGAVVPVGAAPIAHGTDGDLSFISLSAPIRSHILPTVGGASISKTQARSQVSVKTAAPSENVLATLSDNDAAALEKFRTSGGILHSAESVPETKTVVSALKKASTRMGKASGNAAVGIQIGRKFFDNAAGRLRTGLAVTGKTLRNFRYKIGLKRSGAAPTAGTAYGLAAVPLASLGDGVLADAGAGSAGLLSASAAAFAAPILYAWTNPLKPDYGEVKVDKKTRSQFLFGEVIEPMMISNFLVAVSALAGYGLTQWVLPGAADIALPLVAAFSGWAGTRIMEDEIGKSRSVVTYAYQVSHDIDRLIGVGDNKRARASKDALNWSYGTGSNINGLGARGDRFEKRANGLIGATAVKWIRTAMSAAAFITALIMGVTGWGLYLFAAAMVLTFFLQDLRLKLRGPPSAPKAYGGVDL